jgi:hypothetical protein
VARASRLWTRGSGDTNTRLKPRATDMPSLRG